MSSTQEKLKSQIASKQDTMQELATCRQMVAVSLNYNKVEKVDLKVAKTLCARDYKGYSNSFQFMNGVIEIDT